LGGCPGFFYGESSLHHSKLSTDSISHLTTPCPPPRPHRRTESAEGCQLDIALLYEVVADDVMTLLLPINVMRNYALLQVRFGASLGAIFWGGGCSLLGRAFF